MGKLLFITQKIDRNDGVLGVYHRWAEELGKKTDKLNIICLYKGECNLDKNIGVFSLGKEDGVSRIKYVYRFYKYIFSLRKEYDSVLVHMNPVYIALGGFFWKLMGKKIFLWYNHPMGNLMARTASLFSNKIFCTSPQSFFGKNRKTEIMPVGIDVDVFKPKDFSGSNSKLLFLGRISPIKKIEFLIEASEILYSRGIDFTLLIVGSPSDSKTDTKYYEDIKRKAKKLVDLGRVIFKDSIPNREVINVYNDTSLFVNLTPSGSFDKTILEAMSCGLPVLITNKVFLNIFSESVVNLLIFKDYLPIVIADKIQKIIDLKREERLLLRDYLRNVVVNQHSLEKLVNKIVEQVFN